MTLAGLPPVPGANSSNAKRNQSASPRAPANVDKKGTDESKHSPMPNAWQSVFMALFPIPSPQSVTPKDGKPANTSPGASSAGPTQDTSLNPDRTVISTVGSTGNIHRSLGAASGTQTPAPGESPRLPADIPAVTGGPAATYPVNRHSSLLPLPPPDGGKAAKPIGQGSGEGIRGDQTTVLNPTPLVHVGQTTQSEVKSQGAIAPSKMSDVVTAIAPKSHGLSSGSDNGKKQPSTTVQATKNPNSSPTNATPFSLDTGTVRFSPGSPDAIPNLIDSLPFSTIHQALAQGTLANPGMVFVLHLNPPELGQIALKITASADQRIHLHFKVDDLAVKQVLSASWDHLQSSLKAHGLAPEGLTVDLNNTTTDGSFFGQAGGDRPTPNGSQATGLSAIEATSSQEARAKEPLPSRHLVDYIL